MIHINRFIDRIKANEARSSTNFIMPMKDAKDLHADITKLLLLLQHNHEEKTTDKVTSVEAIGDTW